MTTVDLSTLQWVRVVACDEAQTLTEWVKPDGSTIIVRFDVATKRLTFA